MTTSGPDIAVWYDPAATQETVLHRLRLTDGDVDADQIAGLIVSAAVQIDRFVDRVNAILGPPPPADVQEVLVQAVIDRYHGAIGLSAALQAALMRYKQRWGVA